MVTRNTLNAPSLKQLTRCIVGTCTTNAKMSSMKVFKLLYTMDRQGMWATLFSL